MTASAPVRVARRSEGPTSIRDGFPQELPTHQVKALDRQGRAVLGDLTPRTQNARSALD
jgi:hypothetical protein